MSAWLVVAAIALAAASGVPGLLVDRASAAGERIATALMAIASACGVAGALLSLGARDVPELRATWPVPGGAFALRVDALSALFLLQIFVIGLLGSIYGMGYWRQAEHADNGRKLRAFYGLLTSGMALLVVARNAVLFLAGWEVMALAAFLVVTTEDEIPAVREVGLVYLVATRLGTLCLFGMFATLGAATGALDFAPPSAPVAPAAASAIFLLGLVGFGIKAGIMPLHVWLPGAHANAPSHVSALMSGVLIKTGIYGIVRVASLFPHPPPWWGELVLAAGCVSGVLGVAFAVGQHDLKRLLAYHSVENIGIICIGLGVALLGRSFGRPSLVALGLAGALLHVWNHGLFKALLFFAAGSVLHATGTRAIDRLGGLLRAMPSTALAFLLGAVAICGLPPLNGFVSEWLVYFGLFGLASAAQGRSWLAGTLAIPLLALIGGLAVACFVKVYGAVFLGQPRSDDGLRAHESPRAMLGPMAALAGFCLFIGLAPALVAPALDRAVSAWAPESAPRAALVVLAPLGWISACGLTLAAALGAAAAWLHARARPLAAAPVGTWDCGYAAPSARMQYTSSSFAQMLVDAFRAPLRPDVHRPRIEALFPPPSRFESHVPDTVLDRLVLPALRLARRSLSWMRWVQLGSVNVYILYVVATLLVLLVRWT